MCRSILKFRLVWQLTILGIFTNTNKIVNHISVLSRYLLMLTNFFKAIFYPAKNSGKCRIFSWVFSGLAFASLSYFCYSICVNLWYIFLTKQFAFNEHCQKRRFSIIITEFGEKQKLAILPPSFRWNFYCEFFFNGAKYAINF